MKPIYHLDIQESTGHVVLWADTKYGSQPVLGWRGLGLVRIFADMLYDLYWEKEIEHFNINETSERLLEQVFGDDR